MYKIALKMLTGDKAKYYGLVFGITVATFLMAQQVAIFIGVLDRTASQITDVHEADIWVMHPDVEYIDELKGVRDIDLFRVRSVSNVQWAVPFFKSVGIIEVPGKVFKQSIVLGVDFSSLIGRPPKMLLGHWEDLKLPQSIIIDKAGWELIWGKEPFQLGRTIEMNDTRITIVGICDTSAPFLTLPIIYARYQLAIQLAARERNSLTFILVKAMPGTDPAKVAQEIETQTGLQALTKKQFEWRSIAYYLKYTGIPINFGITIALGFLIGAAIAGQTFYIFVIENLRQFAALKAMGVANKQILSMVLTQALLVGFLGFSIGIGLCALFFEGTTHLIFLRGIYLTWPVALGTAISITVIMVLTSFFSIRRVFVLEPAEVFKG